MIVGAWVVAVALQVVLPPQNVVTDAVERLDLSTFDNSLRAQANGERRTLRQLGADRFEWRGGRLHVRDGSGTVRSFRPLRTLDGQLRLCVTEGPERGPVRASGAIALEPARTGLFRAWWIRDRNCRWLRPE